MASVNKFKVDGYECYKLVDVSTGRRLQYAVKLDKFTEKQWLAAHEAVMWSLEPRKRQEITSRVLKQLVTEWMETPREMRTLAKASGINSKRIEANSEASIRKVIKSYLAEYCQPEINSGTAIERATRQCRMLLSFFEESKVYDYGNLKREILMKYPEWRIGKGRRGSSSANTINQELNRLGAVIRHGVKYHGWRDTYALDGVAVKATPENTKAVRPFEIFEVKTILSWLAANSSLYMHDMALLAVCAGLEAKALTLLQKDWFKMDLGILRVYDKLVSGVINAKTQNRARDIPLTPTMIKIFERGHVFSRPASKRGKFATPIKDYSRRAFEACEKETGISNVDWHRFRHTCATARLSAGWQLVRVSRMLGHSNVNTTASHYAEYDLSASPEGFEGMVKVYADFVRWLDEGYFG